MGYGVFCSAIQKNSGSESQIGRGSIWSCGAEFSLRNANVVADPDKVCEVCNRPEAAAQHRFKPGEGENVVLKKYWDLAAFCIAWLLIFFAPEIVAKTTLSYRNLLGLALIFFVVWLLRVGSRFKTALKQFSSHSDPDVAALVDGRIDIAEYRKRKEEREKVQSIKSTN